MEGIQARLEQGGLVKKTSVGGTRQTESPVAISESSSLQSIIMQTQLVEKHWQGERGSRFLPPCLHVLDLTVLRRHRP